MTTVTLKASAEPQVDGYLWIPTTVLHTPGLARVDLFTLLSEDNSPTLLHSAQLELGPEQIAQIEKYGQRRILVRKNDLPRISTSLLANYAEFLSDDRLSIADRFSLLQIATWEQIEHNCRKIYCEQFVEIAQQVGEQIAQVLGESPVLASELYDQSLRDDSRAMHLTNVAGYCVLLARELGITDLNELTHIATGALLHEYGKLFLPQELLHKSGRLTVQERELLERTPIVGYEKLCEDPRVEFGQLMMVYQQHERFDGSGYPVGIMDTEVHLWARILAVADVFDTMISKKAYRRENRVAEALQYVADNAAIHFDPKVVTCWMAIFRQR